MLGRERQLSAARDYPGKTKKLLGSSLPASLLLPEPTLFSASRKYTEGPARQATTCWWGHRDRITRHVILRGTKSYDHHTSVSAHQYRLGPKYIKQITTNATFPQFWGQVLYCRRHVSLTLARHLIFLSIIPCCLSWVTKKFLFLKMSCVKLQIFPFSFLVFFIRHSHAEILGNHNLEVKRVSRDHPLPC